MESVAINASIGLETQLDQFANRLQIRIFFRDIAKRWIHFETGKQMNLRRLLISQKRVVAAHVVVINRLSQQRDGSFHEQLFCLKCFAKLVQTKSGVEKPGSAVWRDAAQPAAHPQRACPSFLAH